MFKQWNLAVNDFLGLPRSGWSEDLPTVEMILAVLVIFWFFWVTTSILGKSPRGD